MGQWSLANLNEKNNVDITISCVILTSTLCHEKKTDYGLQREENRIPHITETKEHMFNKYRKKLRNKHE